MQWPTRASSSALASSAIEMFRIRLSRYLDLTSQRKHMDELAQQTLVANPDFQRLQRLPGIGAIMALTILGEADDLRRFRHHR